MSTRRLLARTITCRFFSICCRSAGLKSGLFAICSFIWSADKLVLFAERPCLNVVFSDAVFHQIGPGTFYATLRKSLIEFRRAAGVCMTTEDQVCIRLVFQITSEVLGHCFQDLCLTVNQPSSRLLTGGSTGLKVNTMERKLGFQLLDLRGQEQRPQREEAELPRSRWWWKRL